MLNLPPFNNTEPNKLGMRSNIPYAMAIVIPLSILSIHVLIFVSSVTFLSFDTLSIEERKNI